MVLLISGISIFRQFSRPDVPALMRGLGVAMAGHVAGHLGQGAEVVLLCLPPSESDFTNRQWAAFIETLKKQGVVIRETILIDNDGTSVIGVRENLDITRLREIAEQSRGARAIVSMAGALKFDSAEIDQWPADLPPLVLTFVPRGHAQYDELLERGFVSMAILPRQNSADPPTTRPKSAAQWLDQYWQIIFSPSTR